MRVGSLFAGIGGLDLGLERSGMDVVWQVEIDPFCQRVLAKHWPDVRRYGDIRDVGSHNLEPVDLICGGFPCPDISNANPIGRGLDGERSGLWWEFLRVLGEVRPEWALIENVSNLKNRGMEGVLNGLREIGYTPTEPALLPASWFGAPQRRRRYFIVANANGKRVEGLVPSDGIGAAGPWGWRGEADLQAIADTPFIAGDRWPTPILRRVDRGLPNRMDRLRVLGNSVVPEVAEWVGHKINEHESTQRVAAMNALGRERI